MKWGGITADGADKSGEIASPRRVGIRNDGYGLSYHFTNTIFAVLLSLPVSMRQRYSPAGWSAAVQC